MKNKFKSLKVAVLLLSILASCQIVTAQYTIYSHNEKIGLENLGMPSPYLTFYFGQGIKGNAGSGKITLSMYYTPDGQEKGGLLYRCYSTTNSDGIISGRYVEHPYTYSVDECKTFWNGKVSFDKCVWKKWRSTMSQTIGLQLINEHTFPGIISKWCIFSKTSTYIDVIIEVKLEGDASFSSVIVPDISSPISFSAFTNDGTRF
jgi:hypothetical protein